MKHSKISRRAGPSCKTLPGYWFTIPETARSPPSQEFTGWYKYEDPCRWWPPHGTTGWPEHCQCLSGRRWCPENDNPDWKANAVSYNNAGRVRPYNSELAYEIYRGTAAGSYTVFSTGVWYQLYLWMQEIRDLNETRQMNADQGVKKEVCSFGKKLRNKWRPSYIRRTEKDIR